MVGLLARSLLLRPCSRPLRALAKQRPKNLAARALLRSTQQAPTQLLAWLQDLAVAQPQQTDNEAAFSRSIMAQADQLTLMKLAAASHFSTSTSTSSSSSSGLEEAAPGPNNAPRSLPDALLSAAMCQQHVAMPAGFAVPDHTTVPAYQFVGIFRSHLGHPSLPQAAKAGSLEAKWGLLSLTLTLAAAQGAQGAAAFTAALDRLLDEVMLPQAARKLEKVLANPKIPDANKQIAQQRFAQVREECRHNISRWAAAACASPAFATLQPVMAAVAGRLEAAITAGHHQPALPGSQSCSSGKLMEQTVRQVLQDALPPGWSLLPSLHLLGADGAAFAVQQGCKYEVDLLILDSQGMAVAIVEVKLGAANPLMSLCNDAGSLLRLVDLTAGKVVTAITQQPAADGAADEGVLAGALAGSGAGWGSLLAKARAATVAAPFSEGTGWRAVHVKVHEHVLPIYILGKTIRHADALKGLSSLVDSSALKLLSRSAEDVSRALLPGMPGNEQSEGSSRSSSGATGAAASSCVSASSSSSSSDDDDGSAALSSGSSVTSSSAGVLGGSSTRVAVNLSEKQQQLILEQLQARVQMLHERCLIYSLCLAAPAAVQQ